MQITEHATSCSHALHIGGPFELQINRPQTMQEYQGDYALYPLAAKNSLMFATIRSAMRSFLIANCTSHDIRRIFVPSYTCPKFVENICNAGLTYPDSSKHIEIIRYHHTPIDNLANGQHILARITGKRPALYSEAATQSMMGVLSTNDDSERNMHLTKHDLVVFNDFFGIPDGAFAKELALSPAIIFHDLSQGLFNFTPIEKAFSLYSLRKWFGIPDGAVLCAPEDTSVWRDGFKLHQYTSFREGTQEALDHTKWMNYSLTALTNIPDRRARSNAFGNAEELISEDAGKLPCDLSMNIMFTLHMDGLTAWIKQRRENFSVLLEQLGQKFALYESLPEQCCPIGFPVFVKYPYHVQRSMANSGIYCPIHWDVTMDVPSRRVFVDERTDEIANDISSHILTLPCDQRYNRIDMLRVVGTFMAAVDKSLADEKLQK